MNLRGRTARRARLVLSGLCVAIGVLGCGGGTSQFEPFEPDMYVAFGDEYSAVRSDGRRYTVNAMNTAGTAVDCSVEPIWTQSLAFQFSFVFAECNPGNASELKAKMRAAPGAKVADLQTQIDNHIASGGFAAKTLASVMLGANDVLELYASYPQQSEEQLLDAARARGELLATQINRLAAMNVRVIVATMPDVGLSPYALQQKAANTDTDRAALLSRLSAALNGRLRVTMLNDGRYLGLVLGDEMTQSLSRWPEIYGLKDGSTAVCTVDVPACTSQTLVAEGASLSWLWADGLRLAYGGQQRLGNLAVSRAVNNPF